MATYPCEEINITSCNDCPCLQQCDNGEFDSDELE